jgi:flagellar protein FlaG
MDSIQQGTAVNAVSPTPPKAVAGATTPVVPSPPVEKTDATHARSDTKEPASVQRDPRSLQFQVEGDRVVTTIVDENNKTVVVQIPDAEVIRIAKAIDRMQGFLLQQKA